MPHGNKIGAQAGQIKEVLGGLIDLIGQQGQAGEFVADRIRNPIKSSPAAMLFDLLKSGVGGISQAAGQASVIPQQQELQKSLEGTQTQQAIQSGAVRDPFLKGAESALRKAGEASANEAIESVGAEETVQKFLQMAQQQGIEPPQQEKQQPKIQEQPEQELNAFGRFRTGFGLGLLQETGLLDSLLKQQELDIEREGDVLALEQKQLERGQKLQDNLFTQINKPLTGTKELSQIESGITGIDNIVNLLGIGIDESGQAVMKNKNLIRSKNFLNKNRQALIRARDIFINKTLRRDSGAVISKEEEKEFRRITGFEIGLKAFFQNPEVIAKSILESRAQLLVDRSRLSPNSELRQFNQFLIQKGVSSASERKRIMIEGGFL